MKLSKLFDGLPDIEITGMELDSRKIKKGDLFFAVTGNLKKGSEFIPDTIKNGAIAIIGDEDLNNLPIPYFKIDELRKNMALIASRFYTSKPKNIIAITGTNGKTSIASFVSQIFNILGYNAASIGTMGVISKDLAYDFGTTTPSIIELNQILESFSKNQVDTVIFEASSHGIDQNRIDYIPLQTAGFTNLSQDHLDYHITIENYKNAKKRLFSEILSSDKIAVINADDEEFDFFANCGKKVWSYGKKGKDIKLINYDNKNLAIEVLGDRFETYTNIIGEFQIMNILCAIGLSIASGLDKESVISNIPKLVAPNGRLEFVGELKNKARIYIDYAHTPDALEKAILALKPYTKSNVNVVFGCGGDRDKTKRPIMGKVADSLANYVYVTDDNPRTEDANIVRKEILQNLSNKCIDAGNRANAIKKAIFELRENDILLIAGKGHETEQIIGTTKHHFSDHEEVLKAISSLEQ